MVNFDRGMQIPAQVGLPDLSPENMTVSDYSGEFEAKISQLEQQIALVKERIARNERALSGKSYEDVNNKLAALEMKKINSQDPTMLWRWQNQRQDTMKANANVKSNEAAKFANTVDMWVNTRPAPTTEGIMQQISNINSAIRDGKNAGADVSRLQTKKKELEALVYGNGNTRSSTNYGVGTSQEQDDAELKTVLATAKTSTELEQYKKDHPELKSAQLHQVDVKIKELKKQEDAKAKAAIEKKAKELAEKDGEVWDELAAHKKANYRKKAGGK